MARKPFIFFFLLLILFSLVAIAEGEEVKSRYSLIRFEKQRQLRLFNKRLSLGSLAYLLRSKHAVTVQDEVKNKIDVIIEKTETILEMYPNRFHVTLELLDSTSEVGKIYYSKYNQRAGYIAFYDPGDKTVYTSVDDVRLGVLAHELAHAIINHYFKVAPSVKIHELLAQYVEVHILDQE